ncbi:hypothetical protein ACFL1B_01745 [Nanoarchaeota archaeon]
MGAELLLQGELQGLARKIAEERGTTLEEVDAATIIPEMWNQLANDHYVDMGLQVFGVGTVTETAALKGGAHGLEFVYWAGSVEGRDQPVEMLRVEGSERVVLVTYNRVAHGHEKRNEIYFSDKIGIQAREQIANTVISNHPDDPNGRPCVGSHAYVRVADIKPAIDTVLSAEINCNLLKSPI